LLLASNGAEDFPVRKRFLTNILTPKAYIELIKYRKIKEKENKPTGHIEATSRLHCCSLQSALPSKYNLKTAQCGEG